MIDCGFCADEPCGIDLEVLHAKLDVYHIACERGARVRFQRPGEGDVSRDPYRGIKGRPGAVDVMIPVLPLTFNPSRRAIEDAGIKQSVDGIATTPAYAWESEGYVWNDADMIRWSMTFQGRKYKIVSVNRDAQIGNDFLYWVFGIEGV